MKQDIGWTCYKFIGPFAFDETGIVSSVIGPLSDAGIGIFVVELHRFERMLERFSGLTAAKPEIPSDVVFAFALTGRILGLRSIAATRALNEHDEESEQEAGPGPAVAHRT